MFCYLKKNFLLTLHMRNVFWVTIQYTNHAPPWLIGIHGGCISGEIRYTSPTRYMIRGQEQGCGSGLKLTGFGSVKNDVAQNQKHLAILILSSLSKKFKKGSMATDLISFLDPNWPFRSTGSWSVTLARCRSPNEVFLQCWYHGTYTRW